VGIEDNDTLCLLVDCKQSVIHKKLQATRSLNEKGISRVQFDPTENNRTKLEVPGAKS
jgi:hypothetical protein